jgi:hypothetical protein
LELIRTPNAQNRAIGSGVAVFSNCPRVLW